jgi:predicted negative regulator of RcsB-dependent stress response
MMTAAAVVIFFVIVFAWTYIQTARADALRARQAAYVSTTTDEQKEAACRMRL